MLLFATMHATGKITVVTISSVRPDQATLVTWCMLSYQRAKCLGSPAWDLVACGRAATCTVRGTGYIGMSYDGARTEYPAL